MKTLNEHTLLYDVDCPLCNLYTSGFIKSKMLDENGRTPFIELSNQETYIDLKRAANEIALVDTKNKTVIYGIDSLLKVIGHSFPTIEKIGHLKPVNFLLKKLYSFISYNRKVIIPSKKKVNALDCIPSFNFKYRLVYIIFAIIISSFVLSNFCNLVPQLSAVSFYKWLIIVIGQLVFQYLFLMNKPIKIRVNYLGNLMTTFMLGSLLLLPIIVLNTLTPLAEIINLSWFGVTALILILEHLRRIKLLELPTYLSITWVLYTIVASFFY